MVVVLWWRIFSKRGFDASHSGRMSSISQGSKVSSGARGLLALASVSLDGLPTLVVKTSHILSSSDARSRVLCSRSLSDLDILYMRWASFISTSSSKIHCLSYIQRPYQGCRLHYLNRRHSRSLRPYNRFLWIRLDS